MEDPERDKSSQENINFCGVNTAENGFQEKIRSIFSKLS